MSLSTHEQELYDHARAATPKALFQRSDAAEEWIGAFAKIFGQARDSVVDYWWGVTYILNATGSWLDQHAKDRGTRRQNNEPDATLRDRLRHTEDAVNPASLIAAATKALTDAGVTIPSGYPALVETRRDRGFEGTWDNPAPNPPGSNYDGRKMAYLTRGYRLCGQSGSIVVILPYGTSADTLKAVEEVVRKKKAGGFALVVERRQSP